MVLNSLHRWHAHFFVCRVQLYFYNPCWVNGHCNFPIWMEKSWRFQLSWLVNENAVEAFSFFYSFLSHTLDFGLILSSALQSDSGKFLLNGGMVIGLGVREFRAAGSKIWYSGSEKPVEQIKIDGKTTAPIKVHVRTKWPIRCTALKIKRSNLFFLFSVGSWGGKSATTQCLLFS